MGWETAAAIHLGIYIDKHHSRLAVKKSWDLKGQCQETFEVDFVRQTASSSPILEVSYGKFVFQSFSKKRNLSIVS